MRTVQLGLMAITVAAAGLLLEAQTPVTGVFFQEGWESGSSTNSFNSAGFGSTVGSNQFLVQNTLAGGGLFALQHRLTAGQDPDSVDYATQHIGDARNGPVWAAGRGQHFYDLFVQYKIYYSAGFRFDTNYKQLEIGTEDDLDQTGVCCNPWAANYLTIFAGSGGGQAAEVNNKGSATPQWIGYQPNAGGYSGSNRFLLQSGRWYTIEVRRKLNDAGVDNGILQMWVDGLMIHNYTNVRFRVPRNGAYGANFTYGTNWVMISDYPLQGVSQNQSIYYDDMKFSTTYIGAGGAGTQPPAPPTNVRIIR